MQNIDRVDLSDFHKTAALVCTVPKFPEISTTAKGKQTNLGLTIVRVQYFVRGGFVGHRSRASSKHLSPHLPVDELDFSRGQTGVALHLQMHVWVDEAHFWLNGYVNKQNCRIWGEANPQVYVETPLHPEKLTVWCALWAGGILLQKR
ncbi:hypothetical protein TNCV_1815081 [Trichonephila clavipes]|nr:hypothetical protein TNCV_1815081 [Trichonephila clavipes]